MATASNKSRGVVQLRRRLPKASAAGLMEFVIFEDNAGEYHWEIVGTGGVLARSGSFASYEETAEAARRFRDGVGSALFDRRAAAVDPVDLLAGGDGSSAEGDAERWLDEGGSFSSEAVATWPARR